MNVDASDVVQLVTKGVRCPSSLRIDLPRRTLYWVDAELGLISSLLLDSGHRQVSCALRDFTELRISAELAVCLCVRTYAFVVGLFRGIDALRADMNSRCKWISLLCSLNF